MLAKQRPLTPSSSGMFGTSYSITRTFQDGNGLVGSLFEGGIILSREEADLYLGTNTSDILAEYGFVFRHDPTASFRNNNDRQLGIDEGIADENSKLWTDRSSSGKLRVPYSFSRSRNVV